MFRKRHGVSDAKYAALVMSLSLVFIAVGVGFTSELSDRNTAIAADGSQLQALQSDLNALSSQLRAGNSSNSAAIAAEQVQLQALQVDLNGLKSQLQTGSASSQSAITALQNDLNILKNEIKTGSYSNGFTGVSSNGLAGLEAAGGQVAALQNSVAQFPMMNQSNTVRAITFTWYLAPQADQDRFEPAFPIVNQGDTIQLTLISNDTVAHDWVLGSPYNIMVNASMPGLVNDLTGQTFTTNATNNSPGVQVFGTPGNVTATYSFVAKYAGVFEFLCTYHAQVGMTGDLTVLPNLAYSKSQASGATTPKVTHIDILKGAAANQDQTWFSPATTVVVIGVNNTVQWTNDDVAVHAFNALDGSFVSGGIHTGDAFSLTFTTPGTYAYSCLYHPWMTGKIIVLEPGQHVTTTSTTTTTTTTTRSVQPTTITIVKGSASNTNSPGYTPATITVVIGQNNSVTWVNSDTAPHTVSATDKSFDSGNIAPGASWSFTFTAPGTYTYICAYHPWMKAQIIVKTG